MSEQHLQACDDAVAGRIIHSQDGLHYAMSTRPSARLGWPGVMAVCAWTLDMVLRLSLPVALAGTHGSVTVAAFAKHVQQAYFNQDVSVASVTQCCSLRIQPEALRVCWTILCRWPASELCRGSGAPTLRRSCLAAFTAQLQSHAHRSCP